MAETINVYGKFLNSLMQKLVDIDSDSIKVALLSSSYTPDLDNHDFFDDVTAYQVTGTGYTAGGLAVTGKLLSYNSSTNLWKFDFDDPSWTIVGALTARYAVIYDATPSTDANRPLMFLIDFGVDKTATDGTFKLTINADGLFDIGQTA